MMIQGEDVRLSGTTTARPTSKFIALILLAFVSITVLLMRVKTQFAVQDFHLDTSWVLELENQLRSGNVLGRDVYFTYGPLAQFIVSIGAILRGDKPVLFGYSTDYLMFDIVGVLLLVVVLLLIRQIKTLSAIFIFTLCFLLYGVVYMRPLLSLLSMVVLVQALSMDTTARRRTSLIVGVLWFAAQLVTTDLVVYNVAAGAIFLFGCAILSLPIVRRIGLQRELLPPRSYLETFGLSLASLIGCNVLIELYYKLSSSSYAWFDYARYSFEILRGYNYTMGLTWMLETTSTVVLVGVMLYILANLVVTFRFGDLHTFHLLFGISIIAFMHFKGALVRSDPGHIATSSSLLIFLFLVIVYFSFRQHINHSIGLILLALVFVTWPDNGHGALRTIAALARGEQSLPQQWQSMRNIQVDQDGLVPDDLREAVDPQKYLVNFPYDNFMAMALGQRSLAPVLQTYSAHTEALQSYYVRTVDADRTETEIIYGLDNLVSYQIGSVQNISRVPIIFRYIYENFQLKTPEVFRNGFVVLTPRTQSKPITTRELQYQANQSRDNVDIALASPESCALLQIDTAISYPFTAAIGQPGDVRVAVYRDGQPVLESHLVPVETKKTFSTFLYLGPTDKFFHLFRNRYSSGINVTFDRIVLTSTPASSPLTIRPSSVSVSGLRCVEQQASPDQTTEVATILPGQRANIMTYLPDTFQDQPLLRTVPDGLFMHSNGQVEVGPFRVAEDMCFVSDATVAADGASQPGVDGVDFIVTLLGAAQSSSATRVTVLPGESKQIRVPLPSDQDVTLRLETFLRSDGSWDWATWRQPYVQSCG